MRVPRRRPAVRVRIVLPGPRQIEDEHLRDQVDRVRRDGGEDDHEDGLSSPFPARPHAGSHHLEPEPRDHVGDEGDRGHEGHDDHVAVAEMADLMGEDRSDLILVQLLEERLRHDEFRG